MFAFQIRSCYQCSDVADVALFTDPEEIYIMKRSGDVVAYDANLRTETVKIPNDENLVPILPSNNGGGVSAPVHAAPAAVAAAANAPAPANNGGAAAAAGAVGPPAAAGGNNQQAVAVPHVGLHEYQLFVNRKEQVRRHGFRKSLMDPRLICYLFPPFRSA